jgi:hypothetical protein
MRVSEAADRVSLPIESILMELMLHDASQVAPGWYVHSSGLAQREWWTAKSHPDAAAADLAFSRDFQEARGWWEESLLYRPRTELGRRLWAIRQRFLSSGARPLTAEEIAHELAVRRGERSRE